MPFTLVGSKWKIVKDPNAILNYIWDWSAWLADFSTPEVITNHQIILAGAPTAAVLTSSEANGKVTAIISGGVAGEEIAATCRITTAGAYVDDWTLYLKVREK